MRAFFLFQSLTLAAFFSVAAQAADPVNAASPGGKGSLRPMGLQETCFKSGSRAVPVVCGRVQVNWKLWTLMGEPIGDYVLGWSPTKVRVADAEGGGSQSYTVENLPKAVGKAVQRMELYVEAVAFVEKAPTSRNDTAVVLAFNTGVAAKPGETSMNVPEGYNWEKFLHGGMSNKGIGLGLAGWCVAEGRQQLNAKDAKAVMRAGVKLDGLQVCPSSTVDVAPVENALAKLCESNTGATPHYCSRKKEAKEIDAIDAAFAKLEDRRPGGTTGAGKKAGSSDPMEAAFEAAETERKAREDARLKAAAELRERLAAAERLALVRKSALDFCNAAKATEDSCAARTCGSKPSAKICTDSREDPTPPCGGGPNTSCIAFPKYTCYANAPNPKRPEWESCAATAAQACATSGKPIVSVDQCVADRTR
ncbi:hypothetical protein [Massilia glaciei]|uniref:Uncharacterized protein n=1 Tax=Massilia glaciei TaxID=1524097 RepID=A0A2U2HNT8_9BURK|nr:hypothetical protein [Massilia glaciei]PWF49178.1 hypothetical protein C7C56_007955 [Massilia glaciei]